MYVMRAGPPRVVPSPGPHLDEQWHWLGPDRGLQLEVIAVLTEKCLLVIHVMPAALRRRTP